ncbi:MAG TPA: hypothetical protein VGK23_03695 [Methanomassiliicoccales archaeon]|jgi:hypothetical protein
MAKISEIGIPKDTKSQDVTLILDGIQNVICKTFGDISSVAGKASKGDMDEIEALLAIESLSKKITKLVGVLGEL